MEGPPPPLPLIIPLKYLVLVVDTLPSPAFLKPLFCAARNLTHLEIWFTWPQFFHADTKAAILRLAPQLLRLDACPAPTLASAAPEDLSLEELLPACTSLRHLQIYELEKDELVPVLRLVPVRLECLLTYIYMDKSKALGFPRAALVAALALPAMAELKRWRLDWADDQESDPEGEDYPGEDGKEDLQELCRARGVDLRGQTWLFTGV